MTCHSFSHRAGTQTAMHGSTMNSFYVYCTAKWCKIHRRWIKCHPLLWHPRFDFSSRPRFPRWSKCFFVDARKLRYRIDIIASELDISFLIDVASVFEQFWIVSTFKCDVSIIRVLNRGDFSFISKANSQSKASRIQWLMNVLHPP